MINENSMLYCLIAFILGYLISRHMGNGFSIGGEDNCTLNKIRPIKNFPITATDDMLEQLQNNISCMLSNNFKNTNNLISNRCIPPS